MRRIRYQPRLLSLPSLLHLYPIFAVVVCLKGGRICPFLQARRWPSPGQCIPQPPLHRRRECNHCPTNPSHFATPLISSISFGAAADSTIFI
jgi:hypothetical protein